MAQRSQKWVEQSNLRDAVRSQEQLEPGSHVSLFLSLAHNIHLPHRTVSLIVRKHPLSMLSVSNLDLNSKGRNDWPPTLPKSKHPRAAWVSCQGLDQSVNYSFGVGSCWNTGTICSLPSQHAHLNLQLLRYTREELLYLQCYSHSFSYNPYNNLTVEIELTVLSWI